MGSHAVRFGVVVFMAVGADAPAGQEGEAAATGPSVRFERVVLDSKVEIGYGVAAEDMDGDGDPDAILVDRRRVRWFENPGRGDAFAAPWTAHTIAGRLTERDHVCVAARDLDGDGRAEIAVGAEWNPGDTVGSGAVFVIPRTADGFAEAVRLPHEPTTHRMRWRRRDDGSHSLVVAPLHGRETVRGEGAGVRILEYLPPHPDPARWGEGEWKQALVDDTMHFTHNLDPLPEAGRLGESLLIAGREHIALLEQDGAEGWRKREWIGAAALPEEAGDADGAPAFLGASEVRRGSLQSGAAFVVTVEPFHGRQVVAYVKSRRPARSWERVVLDDSLNQAHALACGDLLGTGSMQVVAGWRNPDANGVVGVRLYELQGESPPRVHAIDEGGMACEDLRLADFDGDGVLDVLAAGRATANLVLYRTVRD